MTERHNKVISEDDAETLAGLLRPAKQELNRDQRYLDMFDDEVDRAQVNSLRNVAGSNQRTGVIYRGDLPG